MKKVLIILFVLFIFPFAVLFYRSQRVENSIIQKNNFSTGIFPSPLPDGSYIGFIQALETSWKGKIFDASNSSGINLIGEKKVYPFKTYKTKGLTNSSLDVLRLDYNLPQNPFWLRFITDEIVQHTLSKLTGKVYLNLIPGYPLSLGFFKLEK